MTEERNSRDRCGKPEWWSGWEVLQHILGMQWRNFPVVLFYFVVPVHTLSITADQQSRSKIDQTLWKFTATVQSLYARVTRGSRIEEQSFQRYFCIGFLSFLTVWNITTYMLLSVFFESDEYALCMVLFYLSDTIISPRSLTSRVLCTIQHPSPVTE